MNLVNDSDLPWLLQMTMIKAKELLTSQILSTRVNSPKVCGKQIE